MKKAKMKAKKSTKKIRTKPTGRIATRHVGCHEPVFVDVAVER